MAGRWIKRLAGLFINPILNRLAERTAGRVLDSLNTARALDSLNMAELRKILRLLILKEINPGIIKAFKLETERITPRMLEECRYNYAIQPDNASLMSEFITETLRLIPLVQPDIRENLRLFEDLLTLAFQDKPLVRAKRIEFGWIFKLFEEMGDLPEFCRDFTETPDSWMNPATPFPYAAAVCLAVALERGDEEEALGLLEKHARHFGLQEIDRFLPVSEFAQRKGFSNTLIEKSARLYTYYKRSAEEDCLGRALKGRTIAIVANGPYELGKGKGGEIDAHDLVMRMNSYRNGGDYAADYGSKTNVWVIGEAWSTAHGYEHIEYILPFANPWGGAFPWLFDPYTVNKLLYLCEDGKKLLCYSLEREKKGAAHRKDLSHLSVGGLAVEMVKTIQPDFSIDHVYGFAFKENLYANRWAPHRHYYRDSYDTTGSSRVAQTNFVREQEYLRSLFGLPT